LFTEDCSLEDFGEGLKTIIGEFRDRLNCVEDELRAKESE
jgi:hypothetical protein